MPETKALVFIPGNDRKPVVVDTQGAFTVPNVTTPYELIVRLEGSGGKAYARVYKELTLKEPSVLNVNNTSVDVQSNTLTGKVTGQQASSETSRVAVGHVQPTLYGLWRRTPFGGGAWAESSGAYSFDSNWNLDTTVASSLYALQYTVEKDHPQRYLAYGRRDNVSFQKPAPAMDITLSPVTSANLSVDLSGFTAGSTNTVSLDMEHAPSLFTNLDSQATTSSTASFPVPAVPGATFQFMGYSNSERSIWARAGLKAGESLKVALPEGVRTIVPAQSAQDVAPTSTLSWTQFPNGAYTNIIECGDYRVMIDQTTPQLSLPDLSAIGMTLKGDVTCYWDVYAFSPARSANEMIGFNYRRLQELARTDTVYISRASSYFRLAK